MKIVRTIVIALFTSSVISCGQPGPLYLPGSAPPIHVPKEQQEIPDKDQEIEENQEEEQQ